MNFNFKRELLWIEAATLVALVPLAVLWRKSDVAPSPRVAVSSSPVPIKPVLTKMSLGKGSYVPSQSALSPDGLWLARMELTPSEIGVKSAPGALTPTADELVIRSARNGKEAFRALAAGQFAGWIPRSVAFVSKNGNDINVFSPSVARPGAPRATQPWTQTTISFAPDSNIATFYGGGGSTELVLQSGAIGFSPDFRFAVKGSWGKGIIEWEVADLVTGKVAPAVKAGRWLDYDPRVGGFSGDISIAVAPSGVVVGAKPEVIVLQKARLYPHVHADSTPVPTPIPSPTPPLSPAQKAFKVKEARELAALDEIMGIHDHNPKSPQEMERIRTEVLPRFADRVVPRALALKAEHDRLFPTARSVARSAQSSLETETTPSLVEAFDLNTGKRMWKNTVRSTGSQPPMKFSPEGALIVWGMARQQSPTRGGFWNNSGIDFFDARTGRLVGKTQTRGDVFDFANANRIHFYDDPASPSAAAPRSILVFLDQYVTTTPTKPGASIESAERVKVLRFFDSHAREVGYLKLNTFQFPPKTEFDSLAPSQNGNVWTLGQSDWFVVKRRDLGTEVSSPLPLPTSGFSR